MEPLLKVIAGPSCLILEGLAGCELERKMQLPSEAWEEVLGALMGDHFVWKGFLWYREWASRHLPTCYVLRVRKISWRSRWQPTCLPSKSHGQRSLLGYNSWDHKKSDTSEQTHAHTHTHMSWGLFLAYFPSFFYSAGLLNACCPLSLLTLCPKMLTGGRQTIVEGLLLCYFLYAHWPHENSKAFLLNRI